MRRPVWILVALLVLGLWLWTQQRAPSPGLPGVPAGASGEVLSPGAGAGTAASRLPAFLPAEAHYLHLSSTLIKEVAGLGGSVSEYVPRSVLKRLIAGPPAPGQPSRG